MDEEMEEEEIKVYEVVEVDFDYEFDAPCFFDFTRPESQPEVRQSEAWFDSATSYPPSPFVAKLFPIEDLCNVNASCKSTYNGGLSLVDSDTHVAEGTDYSDQDEPCREVEERSQALLRNLKCCNLPNVQNHGEGLLGGASGSSRVLSFFNHLANDVKKTKTKSLAKPSLPRSSTLMRPTASQLAKQNQGRQVGDSRSQKNEISTTTHTRVESQASKRQKLDGGLLRRIVDMKQPINLARKVPKKDGADQGVISQTKLRITIPREPELETAHRAGRIRSTSTNEAEKPTAITRRFKARPLNRKILEAPVLSIPKRSTPKLPDFQAFHLKTTERAKHHVFATTSGELCRTDKGFNKASANRIPETGGKDSKRCDPLDASKMAACQPVHSFRAHRLDSKILTSRGDIGVYRNSKRDATVPKEFEFQTATRNQQNPPLELFSKLSLNGEPQTKSCGKLELSQRASIPSKGSKENRWESSLQNKNMSHQRNEKPDTHSGRQIHQSVGNGGIGETGSQIGMGRTFGSWRQ